MKVTLLSLSITIVSVLISANAHAGVVTFDSFTPNTSVNGQGGWTVEDSFGNSTFPYDEAVVDDGTGNQVLRMSNAVTSTSFSDQTFSHRPAVAAGETGAGLYNDYGTDHTTPNNPPLSSATAGSKYFHAAWDFKSATGGAQPDLFLSLSPAASQSPHRMSYVGIDGGNAGGFDLNFFDTTGVAFNGTPLVTGLSYSDWHTVEMYIEFVDGLGPGAPGSEMGNDIVNILVDGTLVHTGTTWESYFANAASQVSGPHAVDSLAFVARGSAAPGTSGNGIYFDNVTISNAQFNAVPEPSSLLIFGAVAGCCMVPRRRRR
ncbi:hypothetical protein Enr13x_32930 [Stieleria neptunia]|uniref:PEP-CTERM protein-sorting domain-containing protein n=1 Tax=Stieleria neptunia TaxID=2527979 RepID=A0A518HRG3_9BACT|nr:PEP-CTERM sorting domain-containing protein [Stieleria neptunia]QDV43436.1 hypothetical protein Enr13x_32930 [Stieleria neptunia]